MTELRTAADFDALYAKPDPWGVAQVHRRDRALGRTISPLVENRRVIELGCGEGHLTATVFRKARMVRGLDISTAAIARAERRCLPNAMFWTCDFTDPDINLAGFDVITAIECLYYLDAMDRWRFYERLYTYHTGLFIMSAPIIGGKYFTHRQLVADFRDHGLELLSWRNLNGYWNAGIGGHVARAVERLPFGDRLLQLCPASWIYQRLYVVRCGK